jgi:hypothetical protein
MLTMLERDLDGLLLLDLVSQSRIQGILPRTGLT